MTVVIHPGLRKRGNDRVRRVTSSVILRRALGWPTSMPAQALVIAPAFAILVGVFFGFYPARKASRLDPIVALRSE